MTGHQLHAAGESPVGDGDAGISGAGGRGGDAGNHLERNALFGKRQRLFAAATEDEGIAAF